MSDPRPYRYQTAPVSSQNWWDRLVAGWRLLVHREMPNDGYKGPFHHMQERYSLQLRQSQSNHQHADAMAEALRDHGIACEALDEWTKEWE